MHEDEVQRGDQQRGDHELAHAGAGRQQRPERDAAEHDEGEDGELAGDADVQGGEHEQREDQQRPRRAAPAREGSDGQRAQERHAHARDRDHGEGERGVHGEPGDGGQERRGRQDRRPRVGNAQRHPPRAPRQDDGEPLGHRQRGTRRDVDCSVSVEEGRHRSEGALGTRRATPPKAGVRVRASTFRARGDCLGATRHMPGVCRLRSAGTSRSNAYRLEDRPWRHPRHRPLGRAQAHRRRVQGGQPHRLGGGPDLLRGPGAVPRPARPRGPGRDLRPVPADHQRPDRRRPPGLGRQQRARRAAEDHRRRRTEQGRRGRPAHPRARRRPVVGLGLHRRVHARVQRDLRGRRGAPVLEAAPAAGRRDAHHGAARRTRAHRTRGQRPAGRGAGGRSSGWAPPASPPTRSRNGR